ncbi:MAG: ABC transporter permease [Acetobacteraceae bacterium]|nr:ABC transporter permease [Acetobacteraceae bacterium]
MKRRHLLSRHKASLAMPGVLALAILLTVAIHPRFGAFDIQSLAMGALPLAFAAAAQTVVVLAGGIDLSVGSMISLANVLSARMMMHADWEQSLLIALLVLVVAAFVGALNGAIVVVSRVPDVVVTLATGFIWGGVALLILEKPGGGAPEAFQNLGQGSFPTDWVPNALLLLIGGLVVVWAPVQHSRLGLMIRAVGSDPVAAFRSGITIAPVRIAAYATGGLFCGLGGLALTMTTGIGSPLAGVYYTLSGLAAVVIGGVRLSGGRGGILGPVIAAYLLTLIPTDLIFLAINPNYGQVIQGTLIVLVVMAGGLITALREAG